jgi:hypothetical protein
MPLISSFYGVLIYLYWLDTRQHHLPHIHAMYAGDEAVFGIESGELLDGKLPRRQARMVQAWIEIHRDEYSGTDAEREGHLPSKASPCSPSTP